LFLFGKLNTGKMDEPPATPVLKTAADQLQYADQQRSGFGARSPYIFLWVSQTIE